MVRRSRMIPLSGRLADMALTIFGSIGLTVACFLVLPLLAIGASVALLKRGVRCMLGVREEIVALEIGIVAIHCGVLAWAATMAVFLVPGLPAL